MASIKLSGDTSGEITISAPAVAGTTTLTLPITSETLATQNSLGVRNLIINGDMQIAQRGTSVASISTEGYKTVDRMKLAMNRDQLVLTNEQSSDAPANFDYSYKYTVTTAETTVDAGNFLQLEHHIEGLNTGHLAWGSSDAKTITLSFWAKSSSTGVFPVTLSNSAGDWHYPTSYTINSANTWEQKSITVTGATSGTWLNTNGIGISLRFGIAYGSTYNGATANAWLNSAGFANAFVTQTNTVMTTSSATWQITGIQCEIGDTATLFEHRPYDMELTRCQRYYVKWLVPVNTGGGATTWATAVDTIRADGVVFLPTTMRTASLSLTVNSLQYYISTTSGTGSSGTWSLAYATNDKVKVIRYTHGSGVFTSGTAIAFSGNGTSGYLALDGEL